MPRKPFIIVFIAGCFLVSPVFIILQASLLTLTPVIGPYNIFAKLGAHDIFVLLLYPLCAVSIFLVRRWGWYVYVACSLYLVTANIITYILTPGQYHVLSLLAYNLILVVVAGIFFRRDVIAPYFNPRVRWWEQPERYRVEMFFEISGVDGAVQAEIVDISRTGVFLVCHAPLPPGHDLHMVFHVFGRRINLSARLVRKAEKGGEIGYGLKFVHIEPREETSLHGLLLDLRRAGFLDRKRRNGHGEAGRHVVAPRYRFCSRAAVIHEGIRVPCLLLDLSLTGCLLKVGKVVDTMCRDPFQLYFRCDDFETTMSCQPRWHGVLDGDNVCGASFVLKDRGIKTRVKRIIRRLCKAGAPGRKHLARALPGENLAEYALHSPYKIIRALKRRMKKT